MRAAPGTATAGGMTARRATPSVVMDVEECALASILVAMADFVTLNGRGTDFVEAFFAWVKLNLDPAIYNIDCDPDWKPPAAD